MESELRVKYLLEACPDWRLIMAREDPSEEERKLTQKVFISLPELKHLEAIEIQGNYFSLDEFCLFLDGFRQNESITSANIKCWYNGDDQEMMDSAKNRLLATLCSRAISLKVLNLTWGPDYHNSMESVLEVLRSNPDLEDFSISSELNDEHVPLLLNQLRESCEKLTHLRLYGEFSFRSLCALADFAGQSRKIKCVKSSTGSDLELSEQDVEELKRRIGVDNTQLIEFDTWNHKYKIDLVMTNMERIKQEQSQERLKRALEFKKRLVIHASSEANYDLTKFPPEMMFSVLIYTGLLSTISGFFRTCKYWRTIGVKSHFWRHLAAHVMPVIEPEVLQFTEVYYAEHIQKHGTDNCNFWEFLVRHSFSYCGTPYARWVAVGITDKTTKRLPFPHPPPSSLLHEQFLTALLRRYTGLMERIVTCDVKTVFGQPSLYLHLHQPAYVFHYHLLIQSFNNDKVTGYFFISNDDKNPGVYVSQSLDYCAASTVEDALVKMKRMVETFYVVMGRRVEYRFARASVSASLFRAKATYQTLVKKIEADLTARAQQIVTRFGLTGEHVAALGQLAHSLNQKLRALPVLIQTDLVERKQKLPSRNILHTLYPENVLKAISFISGDRDSVRGTEYPPIKPHPKKKPRNTSIKGTLLKVMRIMVNFVVMPVLKTLWPLHVNEMDRGSNKESFKLPGGLLKKYYENFKPLDGVTVDNAAPGCWPMTALVIASQILDQVGPIIEQLVGVRLGKVNKEDVNGSALVESLRAYEQLIPQKHFAEFPNVIKNLVEFS